MTTETVIRSLIAWVREADQRRSAFENFLKSKSLSFLSITPSYKEIILFSRTYNLLYHYAKSLEVSPNQAANDILNAFFKMDEALKNSIGGIGGSYPPPDKQNSPQDDEEGGTTGQGSTETRNEV